MIGLPVMAAVISIGAWIFVIMAGADPGGSGLGILIGWSCYTFTLVWATAKTSGDEVDERPVKEVVRHVPAKADGKIRSILDSVREQLEIDSDSQVKNTLRKRLDELKRLRVADKEAEFEQQLSAKQDELQRAKDALAASQKQVSVLKNPKSADALKEALEETGRLNVELEDARARIGKVSAGREWALKEIEKRDEQIAQLRQSLKETDQQLREVESASEQAQSELANLQSEHAKLETDLKQAGAALLERSVEFENLREASEQAEASHTAAVNALNSQLKGVQQVSQKEIDAARQALSEAKEQLTALQLQQQGLLEQLKQREADSEGLKRQIASLREAKKKMLEDRTALQVVIGELKQQIAGLSEAVNVQGTSVYGTLEQTAARMQRAWSYLEGQESVIASLYEEIEDFDSFINLLDPEVPVETLRL